MSDIQLMQSAAYDVQSLGSLKQQLNEKPQEGLRQVTQQLEATFVQMMLKSMRAALPQDGLFSSDQTRMLTSMYDQQIAQNLSEKGLGFGDMMYKQLSAGNEQDLPLRSSMMPLDDATVIQSMPQQAMAQLMRKFSSAGDTLSSPLKKVRELGLNSQNFIAKLTAPAKAASQKSGVHHLLILAQAALESGWGKREILTADGKTSHNLFGIKAGKGWEGPVTNIMTTEVINGKTIKMRDNFRVYGSYEEAIADYTRLLTENPRYHGVKQAVSPEQAAQRLHKAGYATDPGYSDKLIVLINQIRGTPAAAPVASRAVQAYTLDLSDIF
ncbi:flagellar assembly peptidoglycan hydrolase FlgJ [Morganella morganii]|uniref:flagellar assembly peptidoglycan hydrolase FlgJ n=1 Tax=Morganella morganii TaxID=582 RepID=UPI0022314051|nr:flagellar assembly peptidoglycan hydrolase FlgJ [Morganella morganii]EKK5377415.1 flagellar assembly peptidoglycan hydrolase FlgJ [Morganella morganii]EKW7747082.1 flagellar assembly peptidoglycan hydrolase FlgJ [Morganella morganii]MDM8750227.1 flagellar assembly peptidoglycan hydrolase FlgJ [Morganella morganii]HCR3200097.1 flagellar assembly peptidoglycan hydrolase FlgJ [Morganella morganii]HCT8190813.1 flagellar assembly peptidoglycan hydrolase FlgJ [Morganella morganii]